MFWINLIVRQWKLISIVWVCVLGYAYVFNRGESACEAKVRSAQLETYTQLQRKQEAERKTLSDAASDLIVKLGEEKDRSKSLERKLNDERKKRVYSECVIPAGGVCLFNYALTESGSDCSGRAH